MIGYSFDLTNSGNVTLAGPFTITDDKATDEACPATASLAPGAFITCTASYKITQGDLDAGSVTNTAMGHGYFGETLSRLNDDKETVTADQNPEISLTKAHTEDNFNALGVVLHYTLVATNDGNVTLHDVVIADAMLGGLTCSPAQPAILGSRAVPSPAPVLTLPRRQMLTTVRWITPPP